MDLDRHMNAIRSDGRRFARAALAGRFDDVIPGCPGWRVRDLVRHLGMIHLWAAAHIAFPHDDPGYANEEEEHAAFARFWPDLGIFWPADDDLVEWYLSTNDNLVEALTSASADVEAWTFLPAPSPLQMWARRQAHEIAIHRFDAEDATTGFTGFDPEFAADGVDEILAAFAPRKAEFPVDRPMTMLVHATDTGDQWHVTLAPHGITTTSGDGPADTRVSGRVSDLYLAFWNRNGESGIETAGDQAALDLWHENVRVRWS